MSSLKKLFSTKLHSDDSSYTIEQISNFISVHSIVSALDASKEIIEEMGIKNDNEQEKLAFDLEIVFIVAASCSICGHYKLSSELQTKIMDKVCDNYYDRLQRLQNKDTLKATVDGEFFVRDEDEKNLCIDEFQHILGHKIDKLPKTSLYNLALLLFRKRFLEYQKLLKQDEERMLTEGGFFPLMPDKVYVHWSGKESHTKESVIFSTTLFRRLTSFSLEISKLFAKITIKE